MADTIAHIKKEEFIFPETIGMKNSNPEAIQQYLDNQPPDLGEICETLCNIARSEMPGAVEFTYHNAVNFSWSEKVTERICCVWAQKTYVNFLFFFAGGLPDPDGLFEKGTGKRIRHIKVRTVEDAKNPALRAIAEAAWAAAPSSIAMMYAERQARGRRAKTEPVVTTASGLI